MKRGDLHLLLGALSLTLAGLVHRGAGLAAALLSLGGAALLVATVYGFNRVTDAFAEARAESRTLSRSERATAARTAAATALAGVGLSFVVAHLSGAAQAAAIAVAVIGIGYSLGFGRFRPKNVPVLKNLLIAVPWGLLIVIGAGGVPPGVPTLVTFATFQVFVGSVLRDVDDVDEDARTGVATLPVLLGRARTLVLLRVVNAASIAALAAAVLIAPRSVHPLAVMLALAATWRACSLWFLHRAWRAPVLLRAGNLATCHLMLAAAALAKVIG